MKYNPGRKRARRSLRLRRAASPANLMAATSAKPYPSVTSEVSWSTFQPREFGFAPQRSSATAARKPATGTATTRTTECIRPHRSRLLMFLWITLWRREWRIRIEHPSILGPRRRCRTLGSFRLRAGASSPRGAPARAAPRGGRESPRRRSARRTSLRREDRRTSSEAGPTSMADRSRCRAG